jgi:hypothetical protein
LAVFAFAVEDMNERESVMTSATPAAFLFGARQPARVSHMQARAHALLVPVELAELHERRLLLAQLRVALGVARRIGLCWWADACERAARTGAAGAGPAGALRICL